MGEAGFRMGKHLPPVAGVISYSKAQDGWLRLYDPALGVPKNAPTEAQKAAGEKLAKGWLCPECHYPKGYYSEDPQHVCEDCKERLDALSYHEGAIEWAQQKLKEGFVILDTETTGLSSSAQIVQIAVITHLGEVLLDTLVKPLIPIPEGATNIHGITDEHVKDAPSFGDIYPALFKALHGKEVLIYNKDYDLPILRSNRQLYHLPGFGMAGAGCIMEWFAEYVGEPRWVKERRGWVRAGFKWQPLNGGHTALDDCQAALGVMHEMAKGEESEYA